ASKPYDVRHLLVGGEELAELADPAVVLEVLLGDLVAALVPNHQQESRHQERRLPRPRDQFVVVEGRVAGEDLPVRPVPDAGAGDTLLRPAGLPQTLRRRERSVRALAIELTGDATPERGGPDRSAAVDLDVEPGGQRVHDGGTDAMQTTGGVVRT